jgi:hypothetical protein
MGGIAYSSQVSACGRRPSIGASGLGLEMWFRGRKGRRKRLPHLTHKLPLKGLQGRLRNEANCWGRLLKGLELLVGDREGFELP